MLKENNCCFVLIDVQEKLTRVVKDPHKLKKNIAILLQAFNCLDVPVIWCQQAPKALGDTVPELLEYLKDNNPVNKKSFSCAGSEECNEKISKLNPENIILAGIESHICVYQTAKELQKTGKKVHIVADAVSSRTEENKKAGLDALAGLGMSITTVEMLLFELLRSADHPQFKNVSQLIK